MSSDGIVPSYTMDNLPVARIDELHTHLAQLQSDPNAEINVRLLDEVELQLTGIFSLLCLFASLNC